MYLSLLQGQPHGRLGSEALTPASAIISVPETAIRCSPCPERPFLPAVHTQIAPLASSGILIARLAQHALEDWPCLSSFIECSNNALTMRASLVTPDATVRLRDVASTKPRHVIHTDRVAGQLSKL
jgi:hypothetical protein